MGTRWSISMLLLLYEANSLPMVGRVKFWWTSRLGFDPRRV